MKQVYRFLLIVVIGISLFSSINASILYVKPGAGSSVWQGQTNVYTDLQAALADAISGDQIWVAGGTYKPTEGTDRSISFELKDGVELYGGFAGNETSLTERNWQVNETILSGDIGEVAVNTDNSFNVLKVAGLELNPSSYATILDGFIVEGGFADQSVGSNRQGSGLNLRYTSPIIRNFIFRDNYSSHEGGAVYGYKLPQANFGNVIFVNNRSGMKGGAIYSSGSMMQLHNCLFYNNKADNYGGAIHGNSVEVFNSIAWNNHANEMSQFMVNVTASHCIVQGGYRGSGNINIDPVLMNPENGDFRLSYYSPALQTGNSEIAPDWLSTDFFGSSRITDGTINMGPLEGFAVVPEMVSPNDRALFNSGTSEVMVSWKLPNGSNNHFVKYSIEYAKNGEAPIRIENIESLYYLIQGLNNTDKIQWRVGGLTDSGQLKWSIWKAFRIKREHPLYVSVDGSGSGSSWQDAMSLQDALSTAFKSDQIWVASGTYKPSKDGDRTISFALKDGIELYGGFTEEESQLNQRNWHLNKTILSGNIGVPGNETDNSYHVLTAIGSEFNPITNSTLIDGFFVEAGYADDSNNSNDRGAGMYLSYGAPIVQNVWFRDNYSLSSGGAVYGSNLSAAIFANVLFTNNTALTSSGGAAYGNKSAMTFHNCLFYSNFSGSSGGAISTWLIDDGVEVNNSIAWNNEAKYANSQFDKIIARSSIVGGGSHGGTGIINKDPLFADAENDDFRLKVNSPGIASGDPGLTPDWLLADFAGNQRITNETINMGPLEGSVYSPIPMRPSDYAIFDSEVAEVDLIWQIPEEPSINFEALIIEYIKNNEESVKITVTERLSYVLDGLKPFDNIRWRVAGITNNSERNWSDWQSFRIKRSHPLYVSSDGTGSGISWQDAMSLQEALEASLKGDQIWVASGTYKPTKGSDRSISFELKDGVELYGGFAGNETQLNQRNWRINETILSGEIGEIGVETDNSYNVITAIGTPSYPMYNATIFDGFIVEGGYANGASNMNKQGSGLYLVYASPLIQNAWFRNNFAINDGGAVAAYYGSNATIGNSIFTNNQSNTNGGALHTYTSKISIYNCIFYQNSSNNNGGALSNYNRSQGAKVYNSIFLNNKATVGNHVYDTQVSYSVIQGVTGTGNVNNDPRIINPADGDFRLAYNSPAINAGNLELIPEWLTYDYAGNLRTDNSTINMGIYQGYLHTPVPTSPHDFAHLESNIIEVELLWQQSSGTSVLFEEFHIEYIKNNEEPNKINIGNQLSYELENLHPLDHIRWRVAGVSANGESIWSSWSQFTVKRDRPIYVVETGSGDGSSWQNAMNIQDALSSALYGDQIWVAAGTYYPTSGTDRNISFQLKEGIELYGGFVGNETKLEERNWQENKTILSGDIGEREIITDNSYHVIEAEGSVSDPINNAIIDGIIVEKGFADGEFSYNSNGSGCFLDHASPLIRNTWFRENQAMGSGGAVYGTSTTSPVFGNVVFTKNTSEYQGGAVSFYGIMQFYNCLFYNNYSSSSYGAIFSSSKVGQVINSIAWNNNSKNTPYQFDGISVSYSLVQGGHAGDGNIDKDPHFFDADNGDFRLSYFSPGIGSGNPDLLPEQLISDYAGLPRITNGKVSIGIFELWFDVPISLSPENNSLLESSNNEVVVSWQLPEIQYDNFTDFTLEYSVNENPLIKTESISTLNHKITGLSPSSKIKWRVAGRTEKGLLQWSSWSHFAINWAGSIFVSVDGTGMGTSWEDATSLENALSNAYPGNQLWVAAGTYKPSIDNDRSISFQLKDGIELYGGFAGNETELNQRDWRINKTILSGDIGEPNVETDNSYNVVTAIGALEDPIGSSTVFDGFFIQHGYASGSGVNGNGGGMFLEYAAPIIRNTWFRENHANYQGGALYCNNSPLPLIGNSLFTNNNADYYGGALYSNSEMKIHNCLFFKNHSESSESVRFSNSGIESEIVNSIFRFKAPGNYYKLTNGTPNYSIVEGNYEGTGNIDADPLFYAPEEGDFRIHQNSPANGVGNPKLVPDWLPEDYRGEQRITDGKVSMGVYERSVNTFPIPSYPKNKALFESNIKEVNFSWLLPEDQTEIIIDYTLEYSINNDPVTRIENIEDLEYSIKDLTPASIVKWRVAGQTEDGFLNWTSWTIFTIKRDHPLHVTVDGIGKGTSWGDAINLQEALSNAFFSDQLWVAAGTYKPSTTGDRGISFQLKDGIELYGGFAGNETGLNQRNWQLNKTILSGDIGVPDDETDNSYNVLTAIGTFEEPISTYTIFDGFIIEKGYANGEGAFDNGGAIYLEYASPEIRNVWFRHNYANSDGGAVFCISHSNALFGNVLFTNNKAGNSGGAIFSNTLPEVYNSLFYSNHAGNMGGAAYGSAYRFNISNSILWNNSSGESEQDVRNANILYSIVKGGHSGNGNISSEPMFMNPENGDFRLPLQSPAIGAGNPDYVPEWLETDFNGMPRTTASKVSIGIFEYGFETPIPVYPKNKILMDSSTEEIELSWILPDDINETFSNYSVEYSINDTPAARINNISGLNKLIVELPSAAMIKWRVAGQTEESSLNWSQWSSFVIKRSHPLHVTVDGSGNGMSWDNPTNLQQALSMAMVGDKIWVAAGIYKPTPDNNRTISFQIKDGIELYGGFAGNESELSQRNWVLNKTILSGEIGEPDIDTDNSNHVVTAIGSTENLISNSTIIDGLIIEDGFASQMVSFGGGIYLNNASPIIKNTLFRNNHASRGGALFSTGTSQILIGNTVFLNNRAVNHGGAIYSYNKGEINNSLFYSNYAGEYGGAVSTYDYYTLVIMNSILWKNESGNSSQQTQGVSMKYSVVQKNDGGTESVYSDPMFINADNEDFRLSNNSPAIGAGNPDVVPKWLSSDFAGKPRTTDAKVTIGIFEGGVDTPINYYPKNKAALDSSFGEVELSWKMPEGNADPITGYQLEYSKNNGNYLSLDLAYETTYVLAGLFPGDKIEWRVAARTEDGYTNYGSWNSFNIRRDIPIFVKPDGNGQGSSWYDATSLQEALSIAVNGEQIWVAAGIYRPTNGTDRTISFQIKDGVELYGGFAGNETKLSQRNWRMNETILSGNIGDEGLESDNSYHVLMANGSEANPITNATILDGFIVESGHANSSTLINERGSGLYLNYASPLIRNTWLRGNYASEEGGAVYGTNSSSPTFGNVLFTNNSADDDGGAVYAQSSMKFDNCLFYDNYSGYWGGAIYGYGTTVINSIIWNNDARISYPQIQYASVSYSIVEGGYSGTGNIDADPLFIDSENGDFRLNQGSPAIDAGSRDLLPESLTTDHLGLSRVQGDNVDMGPFEKIMMVNTMPANHGGAKDSEIFGLEFRWGLKDGDGYNESVIHGLNYRIRVWESGAEESPLHDTEITPGTFFETDYNTTSLTGFSSGKAYQWKIAMLLDGKEIWSEPTVFYIGHDHVIHVKTGSEGTDGSNWDNAFGTLHEGLEYSFPGDEIWVAGGTYYPVEVSDASAISVTERETALHLKPGISIFGGFAGSEISRNHRNYVANPTIISGDLSGTKGYTNSSKHLFLNTGSAEQVIEAGAILDGLIFEYASQSAIANNQASPTIRNSIFRNNRGANGAALSNTNSSPMLYQVLFHNNQATAQGGAMWSDNESMPVLINVTIGNNEAEILGGVSGPASIKNSIVYSNIGGQVAEQATVVYSCVEDGFEGHGNTSYDPDWVDLPGGNFNLKAFSSAIDGGYQSFLLETPFYDLGMRERLKHNTIDMGAYEAQTKGELIFVSSTADGNEIHRNDSIFIRYNQPIALQSEESIQLISSGTEIPIDLTFKDEAIVIVPEALEFENAYQLLIPAGAIAFEGNPTIVNQAKELVFSTKSCEPAKITSLLSDIQICPYDALEIVVQTSGDVSELRWIFNTEDLQVNSDTLNIQSVSPDKLGVYTVEVDDLCDVGSSQQVTVGSVETSTLNIVDKWGTVFFVDNKSNQLSDYNWFINDTFLSNSQFVHVSPENSQLTVHALDAISGCVLRSDTIDLSGIQMSAMKVWPNPVVAGNSVSVLLPDAFEPTNIKLFDISGKLMVDEKAVYNTLFDFDKTDFVPGVYILQLEDNHGTMEFERITIE